jgi:hypothetical protein
MLRAKIFSTCARENSVIAAMLGGYDQTASEGFLGHSEVIQVA